MSEIFALASLTNLTHLSLSFNQVSDVSSLASLTNLTALGLNGNQVSDISALASLTKLTILDLSEDQISDISALASLTDLFGLDLSENQISDISALAPLTRLIVLEIISNQISDISPLVENGGLSQGDIVDIRFNPLSQVSLETHIPVLQARGVDVSLTPTVFIRDARVGESDGTVTLTVTLIPQLDEAVTVDYATSDGDAAAPDDYAQVSGTATVPAGTTSVTVSVSIVDDSVEEPDETFTLTLSNPINGVIASDAHTSTVTIVDNDATAITFPDTNLEAAIREALSMPTGDITTVDLAGLTSLDASERGIQDLTGLEHATNLADLNLRGNEINDMSAVGSLTDLTRLNLDGNEISDISAIAPLTNLNELGLGGNQISDISVLASLTNLTQLGLEGTETSDISALASLTNLTSLFLDHNQISDISALTSLTNLTSLFLDHNQISDISALASLTNLYWLFLDHNQISDISALASLTNLTSLLLGANQINDISVLAYLTNLTRLNLGANQIREILALAPLTNLTLLWLWSNQISDISALASLTNLNWLQLNENQISDISALVENGGLSQGDGVDLSDNPLSRASVGTYIPVLQARGVDVSFTPTLYFRDATVGESDGTVTLTLTLSHQLDQAVTVDYATSDGDAAAPGDYTHVGGTATVPAGATSTTVSVPIVDDGAEEPDETFAMALSNATGGATISPIGGTATVTIVDDDAPSAPVRVRPVAPSAVRGGTEFAVEVWADSVQDLAGVAFDLNYDENLLDFVDAAPDPAFGLIPLSTGSSGCIADAVDHPGRLRLVLVCGQTGASGSPLPLWSVTFKATSVEGQITTELTTTDVELSNSQLPPQFILASGGSATIGLLPGVCGDLNDDDRVDIFDVVMDLQIVAGLLAPDAHQSIQADMNRDQTIDIFDAITAVQYLTGIIQTLPGCEGG